MHSLCLIISSSLSIFTVSFNHRPLTNHYLSTKVVVPCWLRDAAGAQNIPPSLCLGLSLSLFTITIQLCSSRWAIKTVPDEHVETVKEEEKKHCTCTLTAPNRIFPINLMYESE